MTAAIYREITQAALEAGWAVDDADAAVDAATEAVDAATEALTAAIERRARAWEEYQAAERLRAKANLEYAWGGVVGGD